MTPDQIAKSGSEHGHQTALFAWAAVAHLHGFEVADAWSQTGKLPAPKKCQSVYKECEDIARLCPCVAPVVPALKWLHAIHNQGHGDKIRGANAKAEGVRAGVADVFLPWPVYHKPYVNEGERVRWCGLYIEMKKPAEKPKREGSKGGVSDKQAEFGEYARNVGYGWMVCYSWREAADAIRSYIEWGSK